MPLRRELERGLFAPFLVTLLPPKNSTQHAMTAMSAVDIGMAVRCSTLGNSSRSEVNPGTERRPRYGANEMPTATVERKEQPNKTRRRCSVFGLRL